MVISELKLRFQRQAERFMSVANPKPTNLSFLADNEAKTKAKKEAREAYRFYHLHLSWEFIKLNLRTDLTLRPASNSPSTTFDQPHFGQCGQCGQ